MLPEGNWMRPAEFAAKHDVRLRTVHAWLAAGLLPGAVRFYGLWLVPADAPRPADGRLVADGKYRNWRRRHSNRWRQQARSSEE